MMARLKSKSKKEEVKVKAIKVGKEGTVVQLVELDDPTKENFKKNLAHLAGRLAVDMVEHAIESSAIADKAKALIAYAQYRRIESADTAHILDLITKASPKKLKLLEGALKKKGLLEDVKRGKATLKDIYNISGRK